MNIWDSIYEDIKLKSLMYINITGAGGLQCEKVHFNFNTNEKLDSLTIV